MKLSLLNDFVEKYCYELGIDLATKADYLDLPVKDKYYLLRYLRAIKKNNIVGMLPNNFKKSKINARVAFI